MMLGTLNQFVSKKQIEKSPYNGDEKIYQSTVNASETCELRICTAEGWTGDCIAKKGRGYVIS